LASNFIYNQQSTRMGFFDSIFHNIGNVVSTISHAISGGVSKAVGLVQHAIPKVIDFARKAGDNLVNVGKQVVGKTSDVVTTVYTDAKGLPSKPFEVLSCSWSGRNIKCQCLGLHYGIKWP